MITRKTEVSIDRSPDVYDCWDRSVLWPFVW